MSVGPVAIAYIVGTVWFMYPVLTAPLSFENPMSFVWYSSVTTLVSATSGYIAGELLGIQRPSGYKAMLYIGLGLLIELASLVPCGIIAPQYGVGIAITVLLQIAVGVALWWLFRTPHAPTDPAKGDVRTENKAVIDGSKPTRSSTYRGRAGESRAQAVGVVVVIANTFATAVYCTGSIWFQHQTVALIVSLTILCSETVTLVFIKRNKIIH